MSDLIFWTKNQLWEPATVLKNGTGGGAPALEQDTDWPMSNLTKRGRYLYWKLSGSPPGTTEIHFDLGSSVSIRAAASVMHRAYPIATGSEFAQVDVYYDNGSTYPPAGWTFVDTNLDATNNRLSDFGSGITGRFWRFDVIDNGAVASCKLWLIPNANRVALGNEYSPETTERERKLKLGARTMAGIPDYYDPVINTQPKAFNRYIRPDLAWRQVDATQRAIIEALGSLDYPFLCTYSDGSIREFALEGGAIKWATLHDAPGCFDVEATMIELV